MAGNFSNAAGERLRVLGEIPLRKFGPDGTQPIDPDGNPDTSFLAKIPADVAWTFQTLDKDGMVLNMAQTWHQVRPGEVRNNCGGCHAHSQRPTEFARTAAARPDYEVFDLTARTPLLTDKEHDESGRRWDVNGEAGLRYAKSVLNVEYYRDVVPILTRSCVACHTGDGGAKPSGGLILDDNRLTKKGTEPETYRTLVRAGKGQTARYTWPFQSRNSSLSWKLFGRRTDGFPEKVPEGRHDYASHLARGGEPFKPFEGSVMPPPEAVAGTYKTKDGRNIKVAPLADEDRRTVLRWIDLGCPIDKEFDPNDPARRGLGWMLDDQRPTLTVTYPFAGANDKPLTRILIGAYDYDTGIDPASLTVTADFPIDGVAAGTDVSARFKTKAHGVSELTLATPIAALAHGTLKVSVKDRQGNATVIERSFSVAAR